MKEIKNIVFDFGGVLIGIDRDKAVKAFQEAGVK
ncbi:MAG: HAD family phosphatase, partial [Phocaeicola sp.]|nr:HAD family phosphatase [Phocaeicola sp.]